MCNQENRNFIIAMIILFCGFLYCCSALKPRQNSMIEPGTEKKIEEIIVSGDLPAVQIAVIDQNKLVWSKTYGQISDPHYVYMNGSVQKVVDATAVLQLYEKGQIDLDADISNYIPFEIKHPEYLDIPITVRMLLSHRSGLDAVRDQFSWDTECIFIKYRPNCNLETQELSLEEYLITSFTPSGNNFNPHIWVNKPGEKYHYSVSAYPLLRYLIEQVSGQSYQEYMKENIFEPLGMMNSGFASEDFNEQHAIPYTRIDGKNIELPVWNGNGYLMRTTAEDMAKFMFAHMNKGNSKGVQILQPESVQVMQTKESKGKSLLNRNTELTDVGYGLGLIHYQSGWMGHGGSTVGYQSLWQFNPEKQSGFVILTNVNGILGEKADFMSVWERVAEIRDILIKQLDPLSSIRAFPWGWVILWAAIVVLINLMRGRSRRNREK